MLKKRIIPCLDIAQGRTVKGINFEGLRDAGDPVELAQRYYEQGADELVLLDITATQEHRATMRDLVAAVSEAIHIPFTVGGGIAELDHVAQLLEVGADKISLNSAAVRRPDLISELARAYGDQCIVVAVDYRKRGADYEVMISGGKKATGRSLREWLSEARDRGAGEFLLTSMDHDGTRAGYDVELLRTIARDYPIPLIASGGAGTTEHIRDVLMAGADGALAASIFHYGEISIPEVHTYLRSHNIPSR